MIDSHQKKQTSKEIVSPISAGTWFLEKDTILSHGGVLATCNIVILHDFKVILR